MITLFTTPKDFSGIFDIIQTNALNSWRIISPEIQILVIGNSKGSKEVAASITAEFIPEVGCSSDGVPLINKLFSIAQSQAKYPIIAYVNADILLPPNLLEVISLLQKIRSNFLAVGSRWDLDVNKAINFARNDDTASFWEHAKNNAQKHRPAGIDYFIYNKTLWNNIPPLAIGRFGWDNWLLWKARRLGVPLINVTECIFAVHQNHGYNFHNYTNKASLKKSKDVLRNKAIIKDNKLTLRDTNWKIKNGKILKNSSNEFRMRNLKTLQKIYPELKYLFKVYRRLKMNNY